MKRRALVVDDNQNNLTLEKDLLEVAGFEVFEAENASRGIAIARKERPDIIIMDVRLPDMRGSEAAKILRQSNETRDIPIVFVTASVMAEGKEEIKAIINTGFIGKPINTRTFVNEISQYIKQAKKPVILVVDDQLQNIELLEAFLVPRGYECVRAASGPEALEKVFGRQIDLILLDVMMPGMDGFEVTRRIRQDETRRLLPIILVTALRDTEDRVIGIEAGCDDFISKPVDKTELWARVRSLLKVKAYNDLTRNYRLELESEVAEKTRELKHAYEGIKAASLETIYRLSLASEHKDEDTGAHIKRMSRYSAAVARRMGLDDNTVESILFAAPMHDLGKIGIPDMILMKPGKLDPLEWEIMKQHAVIGGRILRNSDAEFVSLGGTIAQCHHEKWDGSGYPRGLKGLEIPIAARVTAIADVFDALTSKRPYKEPFSVEKSLAIIKEGRGSHFDPDVVDAFFAIQDEILAIKRQYEDDRPMSLDIPELKALLREYGNGRSYKESKVIEIGRAS